VGAGAEGPDGSAAGDDPDYDDEGHHADEQCPDAVVSATGDVSVRAERERYGNGRVYVVSFTATDGHGGSCAGSVSVCVPRRSSSTTCVDDGQQFNSLGECPQPEDPRRRWHHYGRDGVALTTTSQSGSRATLEYAIDEPSNILIGVYDIAGRRVATLFNGRQDAGVHQIDWVPGAAERGMYFCRLQAGSKVVTQSVLLLRR
jgi:hypothetical protein